MAPDIVEHAIMAATALLLLLLLQNYLNESFSKKELSSHALLFFQDRDKLVYLLDDQSYGQKVETY